MHEFSFGQGLKVCCEDLTATEGKYCRSGSATRSSIEPGILMSKREEQTARPENCCMRGTGRTYHNRLLRLPAFLSQLSNCDRHLASLERYDRIGTQTQTQQPNPTTKPNNQTQPQTQPQPQTPNSKPQTQTQTFMVQIGRMLRAARQHSVVHLNSA